jgi:hypothetical protein
MKDTNPFPEYVKSEPSPLLRPRVVDYLLALNGQGYLIRSDADDFVLPLVDGEIRIHPVEGLWRVSKTRKRVLSTYGDAATEQELDDLLRTAFGGFTVWSSAPERGRLAADKPASNYRTIANLIGNGEIQAVFDTYLDNRGLEHLACILSFGSGSVATNIRLLGTTATLKAGGGKPARFTKAGVDAWAAQLQIKADARYLPKENEHRRFLLLDDSRSLILGPSLNALNKNEAVSIEDDKEDRPFFNEKWERATPLT